MNDDNLPPEEADKLLQELLDEHGFDTSTDDLDEP